MEEEEEEEEQQVHIPQHLLQLIHDLNDIPVIPLEVVHAVDDLNNPSLEEGVRASPSSNPQYGSGASPGEGPSHRSDNVVINRTRFNNVEIRQFLNIIPPHPDDINYANFYTNVVGAARETLQDVFDSASSSDLIQIELRGDHLQQPKSLILQGNENFDSSGFETLLERLVQSNYQIISDPSLEMIVQVVSPPRGRGQRRKMESVLEYEFVKKKAKHLFIILNPNDSLCFSINLAHLIDPLASDDECKRMALELHRKAGLDPNNGVGLNQISLFERALGCKIIVYYRDDTNMNTICKFQSATPRRDKTYFLFLTLGHYYGIINVPAFLGSSYVCCFCYSPYDNAWSHRCECFCSVCQEESCVKDKILFCPLCFRLCNSKTCFDSHQTPKARSNGKMMSNCELYKYCSRCMRVHYSPPGSSHVCVANRCTICGGKRCVDDEDHVCYIQTLPSDNRYSQKYIFYDIETYCDDSGQHHPFLICCKSFKNDTFVFWGLDCAFQFIKKFRTRKYKNTTFIAHNSRSFDGYIMLKALVELGVTPSITLQGAKILAFQDADFKLRFIDSLSFLTMRLAQLPACLGFANLLEKGHFPHTFSNPINFDYEGDYPPPEHYNIARMSPQNRTDFLEWYNTASQGIFNFKEEAIKYCLNDVDVLREACIIFRKNFIEQCHTDPFSCITLSSACMKNFRMNYLKSETLAVPCPLDYKRKSKRYSGEAIEWLNYLAYTEGVVIEHALNRGEKRILQFHVDGYCPQTMTAFEFYGCFWHGCLMTSSDMGCYRPSESNPILGKTFEQIHNETMSRQALLLTSPEVTEFRFIWGCQWNAMRKTESVMEFLRTHNTATHDGLSARDALYGGRTETLKMYYSIKNSERILYVDVTSLYPSVMAKCKFPIKHPTIYYSNFKDVNEYFGFIKASVLPPKGLMFPLLPYKTKKNKLVFCLCRTCAEENNQSNVCAHDDEERTLTGTFVSEELKKALTLNYKIIKIFEAWDFENQSDKIFTDYVRNWLKVKQTYSGFPPFCDSIEDKERYIQQYEQAEGIQLDINEICKNVGKRSLSKLCMNSLFGKFAQRNNLPQTELINQIERFFELMFSNRYQITYFTFISHDIALVQFKDGRDFISLPNKTSNVFISSFITSFARLQLYSYLEQLDENLILYCDTDSLIYVSPTGEHILELGSHLGELTDEMKEGEYIKLFCSSGPKSYCFVTNTGGVVLKCKGVTQTYEASQRLNFDKMNEMITLFLSRLDYGIGCDTVMDERGEDVAGIYETVPQHGIKRVKDGFTLRNVTIMKRINIVFDKRRVIRGGGTLPFGY